MDSYKAQEQRSEMTEALTVIRRIYEATQTGFWRIIGITVAISSISSFILQIIVTYKDW